VMCQCLIVLRRLFCVELTDDCTAVYILATSLRCCVKMFILTETRILS